MNQLVDLCMDLAGSDSKDSVVRFLLSVRGERYLCSDHVLKVKESAWKIWRTHSTAPFVDVD
jgi:hypothetical protein